jgi:hypothetical protein
VADAVLAVPVTNHSAQNGNGKLAAFAKAHSWRKWTAVVDEALRFIAADPDAQEYRFWASVLLETWGNPNEPKERPEDDDGNPKGVSDFARQLGVSKQTVSDWGKKLGAKNMLHVLPGGIYPVDDPSKPFPKLSGEYRTKKGRKGEDHRRFLPIWEQEHADDARRQAEIRSQKAQLRAEEKLINRRFLTAFKAWSKSEESRTNEENCPALPVEAVRDSSEKCPALPERIYKEEDLEVNIRGFSEFELGGGRARSSSSEQEERRAPTPNQKPIQEDETQKRWTEFVLITEAAGMQMTSAERLECEREFLQLPFEEQLAAAKGVHDRIECLEYERSNPHRTRYIHTVYNYLTGRIWERAPMDFRPPPPKKKRPDTSWLEQELAEAKRNGK